jgi:APA family basic amino acid/polyamine antiporter
VHLLAPGLVGDTGSPSETVAAAVLVLAVTVVALSGVKRAALVQNACMVTKLLVIAALVIGGLLFVGRGDVAPAAAPAASARELRRAGDPRAAAALYTLGGWQLVGYIAPEMQDPVKNLPRAILLGVLGVVAVYLCVNASYLAVLGIDGLIADKGFAQTLAQSAFGSFGSKLLAAGMCISAFGICAVNIITTPWCTWR